VASRRWVTPGAATDGVTPQFFPEKPGDLFHPTPFYLSDLVSQLFFVNLPTKKLFLRVLPPWRVSPGAVPPLPSPSDATGRKRENNGDERERRDKRGKEGEREGEKEGGRMDTPSFEMWPDRHG